MPASSKIIIIISAIGRPLLNIGLPFRSPHIPVGSDPHPASSGDLYKVVRSPCHQRYVPDTRNGRNVCISCRQKTNTALSSLLMERSDFCKPTVDYKGRLLRVRHHHDFTIAGYEPHLAKVKILMPDLTKMDRDGINFVCLSCRWKTNTTLFSLLMGKGVGSYG